MYLMYIPRPDSPKGNPNRLRCRGLNRIEFLRRQGFATSLRATFNNKRHRFKGFISRPCGTGLSARTGRSRSETCSMLASGCTLGCSGRWPMQFRAPGALQHLFGAVRCDADLPWRHTMRKLLQFCLCSFVTCCRRSPIPDVSVNVIQRHSFSLFIQISQIGLRRSVSLFSSQSRPLARFRVVGGYTRPRVIHPSKVRLRRRVAPLRRNSKPPCGLCSVLPNASPPEVQSRQIALRDDLSLVSCLLVPLGGLRKRLRHALAVLIQ